MKIIKKVFLIVTMVLFLNPLLSEAAPVSPDAFVRNFFKKYYPLHEEAIAAEHADLNKLPLKDYFSEPLLGLIRQDIINREKYVGTLDYQLEFNPFFYSQEDTSSPVVSAAKITGETASVPVKISQSGTRIIYELKKNGESWLITNLQYPAQKGMSADNLIHLLQQAQKP